MYTQSRALMMLGYFIEGEEAKTHWVIIVVFHITVGPHRVGAQIHQQEAPHCPQQNWSLLSSANLHSVLSLEPNVSWFYPLPPLHPPTVSSITRNGSIPAGTAYLTLIATAHAQCRFHKEQKVSVAAEFTHWSEFKHVCQQFVFRSMISNCLQMKSHKKKFLEKELFLSFFLSFLNQHHLGTFPQ